MDQDTAVSAQDITGRSQVEEGLRRRNAQLDLLARVSQLLILNRHTEQETLTIIFSEVATVIGAEMYVSYLPHDEVSMRLSNWGGLTGEERTLFDTMRYGEQLCGRVAAWRKPIVIEDIAHMVHEGSEQVRAAGYGAYAGFPLLAGEQLFGTIAFLTRTKTHFAEGDVQMVQTVCDQAAAMMDRARLMRELRDSEVRIQQALRVSRSFTFDWEPGTDCVRRSASGGDILHLASDDAVSDTGQRYFRQVTPEDRAELLRAIAGLTPEAPSYSVEYRVTRGDGAEVTLEETGQGSFDAGGKLVRLFGVATDITARKQAEERLRASEWRFRAIFNHQFQFSGLLAPGGQVIEICESAHRNAGTRPEDFAGKSFLDAPWWRELPETRRQWQQQIEQALAGRGPARAEAPYVLADGTLRHALNTATAIRNDRGEVEFLLVEGVDITELKRTEEKLRASEARFRLALENAPVVVAMQDVQLVYQWSFNNRTRRPEDVVGKTDADLLAPEDLPSILDAKRRVLQTGEVVRNAQWLTINGQRRFLDCYYEPVRDAAGAIAGIGIAALDLTEQKQAEAALAQTTALLETLLAAAPLGFCHLDRELRYVRINQQLASMNGIPAAAHLGKSVAEIVPALLPAVREVTERILATGEAIVGHEIEGETPLAPGVTRSWSESWYPVPGAGGEVAGFGVIVEEITARKLAERQLRESDQRLRLALAACALGFWEWNVRTNAIRWDEQMFRIYGLPPTADGMVTYDTWKNAVLPEDLPGQERILRVTVAGGGESRRTFRIRTPEGAVRHIEAVETVRCNAAGQIEWVVGTNLDVTERQEAEATLRQSREDMDRAQAVGQMGWWRLDTRQNVLTWSDENHRIFGVPQGTPLSYESFLAAIHPGDRQEVDRRWQAAMRGEPYDFEHRIVADGQVKWVREKAYLEFDGEGHLLGGFGITQDITERKHAEAERQKFVSLADQSAEFIGMCDQEFKPFYVNQAGRQRVGLDSLEAACAVQVQDFFFPEDRAMITGEFFPKVLREGRAEVEVRFRHFKTGAALWMIYNVFQIKDAAGQLAGYATVSRDITARKQAEEALRDGEQRLAGIVGSAMDAIISVDEQQRLVLFNAAAETMFGYPAAAILGSPLSHLIPDRFRAAHGQHLHNFGATGVTSRQMGDLGEIFGRRANGEEFPIEASISQGTTGGGKLYTVILRDITARKQAEAALQAHLREKDVLLHEIHHRVKNNLQVISSLVSLQSGPVTGEGRETLDNIRDQVRAMALVHEQLYQAGDFGRIEFAEYARKLLTQLWRAYGNAAAEAELKLDLGSVTLPITAAVPCGLVLNELAGNALKHAFRGFAERGEVKVSLQGGPGGEVCLGVTDNGVGLPEGLDWRQSKSLGLRLVQMLAKQLGGTVESRRPEPGGTGFELRFRLAED